ncbi:helix-turn-helix domain-containing protein [Streptomyces tirandamycinicus]
MAGIPGVKGEVGMTQGWKIGEIAEKTGIRKTSLHRYLQG